MLVRLEDFVDSSDSFDRVVARMYRHMLGGESAAALPSQLSRLAQKAQEQDLT